MNYTFSPISISTPSSNSFIFSTVHISLICALTSNFIQEKNEVEVAGLNRIYFYFLLFQSNFSFCRHTLTWRILTNNNISNPKLYNTRHDNQLLSSYELVKNNGKSVYHQY